MKRADINTASKKAEYSIKKRLIHAIQLEFWKNNEWHNYEEGALLKTGQEEEDDAHKEREIKIDKPFKTNKIKVHFPATQSQTKFEEGYIGGRIELLVVEDEKAAFATAPKMGSPKECTSSKDCKAERAILDLGSTTNQSSAWK